MRIFAADILYKQGIPTIYPVCKTVRHQAARANLYRLI